MENNEKNNEAILALHQSIINSLREKENETFKFVTALAGGSILPIISFFIKDYSPHLFYPMFIVLCILSILLLWWGAYFILSLSYQYRNLQRGLSEIQTKLNIFKKNAEIKQSVLPNSWNVFNNNGISHLKCVLTEFYKPHFYAFICGKIIISFIAIIFSISSLFNVGCNNCCHLSILHFLTIIMILLLVFISLIHIFYTKCSYDKKIKGWVNNLNS